MIHYLLKLDQASGAETSRLHETLFVMESLILAQSERLRRGLGMQVERDP